MLLDTLFYTSMKENSISCIPRSLIGEFIAENSKIYIVYALSKRSGLNIKGLERIAETI